MRTTGQAWAMTVLLATVVGIAGPGGSVRSPDAAGQLVALMEAQKLDLFAAEDPEVAGRFVAAMLVPDIQLLVVAAKTTAPEYLKAQLAQRNYSDVYVTLHASAVQRSKVFFQDMGSDGLRGEGDDLDIMYERGTAQTVFDGDWRGQNLSRNAYREKLQYADTEYTGLLHVLIRALGTADPVNRSS